MVRRSLVWGLLIAVTGAYGARAADLGQPTEVPASPPQPQIYQAVSQPAVGPPPQPASQGQPRFADDPAGYLFYPFKLSSKPALKQSIFVFGGFMSETDIWSTAVFNLTRTRERRHYDNNIAGIAYQKDLFELNGGLKYGFEVGVADRFGHYQTCCTTIVYSNSMLNSFEFWGGLTMRYQAVNLFNMAYLSPGVVFGLSYITSPIGQEGLHQLPGGSTKLLFYLAFEGALAFPNWPDTEVVLRLHHRSGAFGTLGAMHEGNNANTIGIRQRF